MTTSGTEQEEIETNDGAGSTASSETKMNQETKHNEEEERDEEGLLLRYDTVLCGTGLVQSILASALARAGQKVLHCDGAGHYGELEAVWNLPYVKEELRAATAGRSVKERVISVSPDEVSTKNDLQLSSTPSEPSCSFIPLSEGGALTSLQVHSTSETTDFSILELDSPVETPFGNGVVTALPDSTAQHDVVTSLSVSLKDWKLADGTSPVAFFGVPHSVITQKTSDAKDNSLELYLRTAHKIQSSRSTQAQKILEDPWSLRSLVLDVTPSLVFASGLAVEGMLSSGVAEYVEFKPLEGLFWLEDNKKSGATKVEPLSRVPCSKGDVFGTKLLAPMDKRRLMKFMQLSMDYATSLTAAGTDATEAAATRSYKEETNCDNKIGSATEKQNAYGKPAEQDVQSLNERHLNQGRSLARPQNKAVSTQELKALQESIASGSLTFETYLSKTNKLSPRLRSLVRYALAMETEESSISLLDGMTRLRRHLQALGRYGTTAFLIPMYGSGELSQAFCRSAAVFGATYLLRRAPLQVQISAEGAVSGVVVQGDNGISCDDDSPTTGASIRQKNKQICCSQAVVSAEAMQKLYSSSESLPGTQKIKNKRILRRISILRGKLMMSQSSEANTDQRHMIIIPPKSPILGNSYAIHGIVLDQSVQVAPRGCTLLHLTTTTDEALVSTNDDDTNKSIESYESTILDKACQFLLHLDQTGPVDELFHLTFSHAFASDADLKDFNFSNYVTPTFTAANTTVAATSTLVKESEKPQQSSPMIPKGLHVCHHSGQELAVDVAFEQAKQIFTRICPGKEFLGLSEDFQTILNERAIERGEDDEDRYMLDSAVDMIEKKTEMTTAKAPSPPRKEEIEELE